MNTLTTIMTGIQILSALIIIGLVLVQHGKGADMGAAFGSGASGSLFGATGSSNFLSKSTGVAATIFFAATLGLAYLGEKHTAGTGGVMESLPATSVPVPATTPAASKTQPAQPAPQNDPNVPADTAGQSSAGQSNQIPK